MTSKGFKDLMKLLSNKRWAKAVKTLDISENRIGKTSGSQSLAAWLQDSQALEEFSASFCELDLEVILDSLKENNVLLSQTLESLNLSGNKMTTTCMGHLEAILQNSVKLEHIYLAKTSMKRSLYESLFVSIKGNAKGAHFFLDLSNNDVGAQFGKSIGSIFDTTCPNISALVLMQNELGAEGIITLCRSLRSLTSLHTLVLDVNASKSLFTKINDVGSALAGVVQDLPSLKVLSIAGDAGHYFKSGLIPLFNYLCENRTLTHLNVQSNRLQDDGFDALIDVVKKNQVLQILDSDNNTWKLKYIRKLRDAMMLNNGLSHKSVIPFNDIATIYATYPKYKEEIHQLLADIEVRLAENEKISAQKMSLEEIKQQKRMSWAATKFNFDPKVSVSLALDEITSQRIEEHKAEQADENVSRPALEDVKEGKEDGDAQADDPQLLPKSLVEQDDGKPTPLIRVSSDASAKSARSPDSKSEAVRSPVLVGRSSNAVSMTSPSRESVGVKGVERSTSSTFISNDDVFAANTFALEELKDCILYNVEDLRDKDGSALPAGVNSKYKEMYLKDDAFEKLFDCTKEKYLALPRWKQVRKKREAGLF
eukprot:TRINITY_DN17512_c0_g2_i2.p1 TRINITY_DN17512_c0_g2~~TRINITY_DN17512_c0_g2_i2.p1  ORF type:complete len:605 (-),score=180.70 TRINITY_DN17512_c0_g2_i2:62-1846(-)